MADWLYMIQCTFWSLHHFV